MISEAVRQKIDALGEITLAEGAHDSFEQGYCAMELVSYLADEPFSDTPQCTCPVLTAFVITWNDGLPDDERTKILAPFLPRLIGTRNEALEEKRALMAADWLVRTHTVAWLRLAGLNAQANSLANLPEITAMTQVQSIHGPLEAARKDADAAWNTASAPGRFAARAAVRAAAWDAAWDAARATGWDAARDAAWDAARAAALSTALVAATEKFAPTQKELQKSAGELLTRMIEADNFIKPE